MQKEKEQTMSDNSYSRALIFGYIFALGATAIWSGNFIVARGLSDAIPPVSLAFSRWVVAILALLPFAVKNLISEWQILRDNLGYLSITAFLGITTFNTFIYIAGKTTTAINLSLIAITFPVFILILSRLIYKEPVTIKKLAGVILVLCGVLILITKGKIGTLLTISFSIGDIWMLLASIIFAVYSMCLKKKPENISIMGLQSSTFILGLIFLLPFFVWELRGIQEPFLNRTTIPAIMYVGVFASLCAFVLWNKAIVILGPSKAGMVYYTLPLFSGLLGYFFLNEGVGILHIYSLFLILSGIVITNHESKKNG